MRNDEDRMWGDPDYYPPNVTDQAKYNMPPYKSAKRGGSNMPPRDNQRSSARSGEILNRPKSQDLGNKGSQSTITRSAARQDSPSHWFISLLGLKKTDSATTQEAIDLVIHQYKHEHAQEVKKLEDEKNKLLGNIRDSKNQIYDLQAQVNQHDDKIAAMKRQEQHKLQAQSESIWNDANRQVDEHFEMAKNNANQRIDTAKKDCERLRLVNQDLDGRCLKYETELNGLRAQVKRMQEAYLRNVESEHWAPLSVSEIDRKLKTILNDVKQWSVKYATVSLEHMAKSPGAKSLVDLLHSEKCIPSKELLLNRLDFNKTMENRPGKAASLLLAALASSIIVRRFIGDQFVAFGGSAKTNYLKSSDSYGLKAILDQLMSNDEASANAWRCQMFRLIDPINAEAGTPAEKAKKIALDSREAAAQLHANNIVNAVRHTLIPENDLMAAYNGLETILLRAAELSWTFATRKQKVVIQEPPIAYRDDVEAFEAHPLHTRELEDEPEAMDGCAVVLLCSPAVVAYGTADGTNYDKCTIWRKGVVWLG